MAMEPLKIDGVVRASDVLTCDVCKGPIDDLPAAMLFWSLGEDLRTVSALRLAHKRHRSNDAFRHSLELWWMTDPSDALRHLADRVVGYEWPAAMLKRFVLVAWAVRLQCTCRPVLMGKKVVGLALTTGCQKHDP